MIALGRVVCEVCVGFLDMCQSRKTRLAPQLCEHVRCLRALQAEGIEVDIPDEWLRYSRPFDVIIAPPPISVAFDWPSGGAGYVIGLRLLSRKPCMLQDCAVTVPWDDVVIQSLDERKSRCDFGPLVFSLGEVLNPRIENTLRFPRAGHPVEGVILGRGGVRIPKEYTSFARVPFVLTLYDQYGDEFTAQGHLSVGERRKAIAVRKRTGLLSRIGTDLQKENTDSSTLDSPASGSEYPLNSQDSVEPIDPESGKTRLSCVRPEH